MFYNYRNKIYIIGVFLLLFFAFFVGRSSVSKENSAKSYANSNTQENETLSPDVSNDEITPSPTDEPVEIVEEGHIEYKTDIEVKGSGYTYIYKLSYATIINKNLNIIIDELKKDKNIVSVVVQATNETNNPLKISSNGKGNYVIELNQATDKVNIKVIPLTKGLKDSMGKKKIKIEELPFGATSLNIKMLINEIIEELEANYNEG